MTLAPCAWSASEKTDDHKYRNNPGSGSRRSCRVKPHEPYNSFKAMGVNLRFSNRSQKPGKPTLFGTRGNTLFFSLSGNPYASMLSFDQLIKPALYKMMGHPDVFKIYSRLNGHFSNIDIKINDSYNDSKIIRR